MRAAQLYIKETGKYVQLGMDSDFPFTLSKSIAEIQDVSKRNKTFSKSFKIPATEDNVKALGYPHVIGTDLDAINVYKQQCFIIVNGNVIDDGYVYILKARRDTDAIEFECQFVGGNEAWVVALQSLKMSEVVSNTSGAGLTVTYTDANIRARYNTDPTTLADPSYIFVTPYIHMFNDGSIGQTIGATNTKIGRSRNARGQDFWPAFRLDYLIDGIFGTATNPLVQSVFGFDSFELDSDFLTDNATHGFWSNIYYSDRSEDEYPNVSLNGSASNWGNFLPQDVSMLDFFMKLVRTFNLVFSFDGITLKVEPRQDWKSWNGTTYDGFYSGDIDWSEKVSVSQEIQYKTSNYKRQIRLTYEQDSYPLSGQQYPFLEDDMVSQPELRYIVDTENNNQEGITDIVLPFNFSPSKFYQGRFDYYRSHNQYDTLDGGLDKEEGESFRADNKFANRLFVFKVGSKPTGVEWYDPGAGGGDPDGLDEFAQDTRWRDWIYEDAGGTLYYNDDYPFMYNCITVNPYSGSNITVLGVSIYYVTDIDDTDEALSVDVTDVTVTKDATFNFITNVESNSIDDINLGIYKSNTVDMPDGLYERFWKTTIDQLITTRTLVTQVLMTRNEFVSLDISKYYTLMGQRFILNKVKDFDPMLDEQMVEVELLAVDAFRSSEEVEPPAATLLLDLYGDDIEAAYSLRKLRAGYTGAAIRVRRTPDNTEQDIGFDINGDLDTSALTTFVGSGSAHIQTWYDQSTNANHAVQNTSGQQPHIVYNGTIKTHGGKPAVTQDSDLGNPSNQFLDLTSTVNAVHNFIVFYQPAVGGGRAYYAESASRALKHDGFRIDYEDGVNPRIDGSTNIRTDYVLSEVKVLSGTATSIINSSSDASGTANVLALEALMGYPTAGGGIVARMQEMLFFGADKSTDATAIQNNINTHYTIF